MEEEKGCGGGPISLSSAAAPVTSDCGEQVSLAVECPEAAEPPTSTDFLTATLGLDDKMPFLQMLQTLYSSSNIHSPMKNTSLKVEKQTLEGDSFMPELHSPVISEVNCISPHWALGEKGEAVNSLDECRNDLKLVKTHRAKPLLSCSKMRKTKRAKVVVENKKDAEKQRMTHIAVERNRRRLMSDYLVVLRSLLPHDYAPKGDQASIVGGVIDYVKKLEHHVQYLETQKRAKKMDTTGSSETSNGVSSTSTRKRQFGKKADVNIMVVHTHANLRIECEYMKQSQLIKFLAAVEELGLTILHLNINSIHSSSFYNLSLRVEDECKIRSAEDISSSVEKVLNSLKIYNGA